VPVRRRLSSCALSPRCSSGGSIVAAHLVDRLRPWPQKGQVWPNWNATIAQPFREFTARDIRTAAILKRLLPWNWWRTGTGVEAMASVYEQRLTRLTLDQLPEHPRFVFCSTDMAYGVAWVAERQRVGDYQAGFVTPAPPWRVARAVAASSCFPPVFNPLAVGLGPDQLTGGAAPEGKERDDCIRGLRLTDGGVYDNLGLEPVWKNHATLLVSDGGGVLAFEGDKNLIWRVKRYASIQGNQVDALRKRWLMSNFIAGTLKGTYWGVGGSVSHYDAPGGYSPALAALVRAIRTDLDAFSEAEAAVLENHGYLLADAAVLRHARFLCPGSWPTSNVPHPEWMDENRMKLALRDSGKRRIFGH
jgi:NTE family protein